MSHSPLSFLHSFFFLSWLNDLQDLSYSLLILFSAWSSLLLNLSSKFFQLFFSSMISIWHFLTNIFSVFVEIPLYSSIVLLTLVNIFLMVTLNYLSGKSCISVSLGSFWRVILFVWNIFAYFFIFINSLCWWLCVRQSSHRWQSLQTALIYSKAPTSQPSQRNLVVSETLC